MWLPISKQSATVSAKIAREQRNGEGVAQELLNIPQGKHNRGEMQCSKRGALRISMVLLYKVGTLLTNRSNKIWAMNWSDPSLGSDICQLRNDYARGLQALLRWAWPLRAAEPSARS